MVDISVSPEQSAGRWPTGKPFPAVLYDTDLMSILDRGHTAFYRMKKAGAFKPFEIHPQLAGNTQYSGRLVEKWTRGELEESRFFQSARRNHHRQASTERRGPGRPRKSQTQLVPLAEEHR